jgi:hypothetical protein
MEMFKCERCGSGYNGNYVGVENCPRCLLLDRVQAPLAFTMRRMTESGPEASGQPAMPSEPVEPAAQRVRSAR